MYKYILIGVVTGLFMACSNDHSKSAHKTNLVAVDELSPAAKYQEELSAFYENDKTTPLSQNEKAQFGGIDFFPLNKKYILKAHFKKIDSGSTIPFPTSAKKMKHYKEFGLLQFVIDGQAQELTLYESVPAIAGYEDALFLPFKDVTTGFTSYGAGRYLDVNRSEIEGDSLLLDFNKAYNPYCAYSTAYNCPIPPSNNTLTVSIEAGVRYILANQ